MLVYLVTKVQSQRYENHVGITMTKAALKKNLDSPPALTYYKQFKGTKRGTSVTKFFYKPCVSFHFYLPCFLFDFLEQPIPALLTRKNLVKLSQR